MNEEMNYFQALKELRNILNYTQSISTAKIAKQFKLPSTFSKVLVEGKIVIREGKNNNLKYTWNTIEPNLAMAKKVKEECVKTYKSYYKKDDKKKVVKRRRKSNARRWTAEETKYVIDNNGIINRSEMSKKLGRSLKSIETHLTYKLGTSKPNLSNVKTAKKIIDKSREPKLDVIKSKATKSISILWGLFKYETN